VHDEGMSPDFDGHAEWVEHSFYDNKAKSGAGSNGSKPSAESV